MFNSFDLLVNRRNIFKAGEGAGRSGSFFFASRDGSFIVKTMSSQEKQRFLQIIDDYIDYLTANPNSLITRVYGIFTIKQALTKVDIMIMQNCCQLVDRTQKKYEFDLKGSKTDRYVSFDPNAALLTHTKLPIYKKGLKCQNLQVLNKKINESDSSKKTINLTHQERKKFAKILKKDADFFASHALMDYSLIFVAEHLPSGATGKVRKSLSKNSNIALSTDQSELYHFGVIDFLQTFNLQKCCESYGKQW